MSMRFKPGQEVVTITKNWWYGNRFRKILGFIPTKWKLRAPGPQYNELVTVVRYSEELPTHCSLVGYDPNMFYSELEFEPVITTEELNEALKEVPEKIEI